MASYSERSHWPKHRSWRGCLNRILFSYAVPLLDLGTKQILELNDLPLVCDEDSASVMNARITRTWREELERPPQKRSFFRALHRSDHFRNYLLFLAAGSVCQLSSIQLLRELLLFINDTEPPDWTRGIFIALAMVGAVYAAILVFHYAWFTGQVKGMRLRVAAVSLIYDKVLKIPLCDLSNTTPGRLINICSNDVEYIQDGFKHLPPALLAPFEVPVIAGLLWREVGVSALVGLSLTIFVFLPLQLMLSSQYKRLRTETAEITDKRVKTMGEIIVGIRTLKAYAWESAFEDMISEIRKKEMVQILKTTKLKGIVEGMFEGMGAVLAFGCFCPFVVLGNQLTATTVFVTLALCGVMQNRVGKTISVGIRDGTNCWVSCKRIEKFLLQAETMTSGLRVAASWDEGTSLPVSEPSTEGAFHFSDATISWQQPQGLNPEMDGEALVAAADSAILKKVTFEAQRGDFIAVVGRVGSGKTTVLLTLAQELGIVNGQMKAPMKRAVMEQEPWIQSGTIRQNILFGREFHQQRYDAVLHACALQEDLRQLHNGDLTLVGDNGVTLSGGQRARICLARCAYVCGEVDLFLLDDPLSAVDSEVGRQLFDRCICGIMANTTRVLATHQVQYLLESAACTVVILDDLTRSVTAVGKNNNPHIRALLQDMLERSKMANSAEDTSTKEQTNKAVSSNKQLGRGIKIERAEGELLSPRSLKSNNILSSISGNNRDAIQAKSLLEERKLVAEIRSSGALSHGVIKSYIRAAGGFFVCGLLVGLWTIFHATYLMAQYYFATWALASPQNELKYTLGGAAFVLGALALGIIACVAMGVQLLAAPRRLHDQALQSILSTFVLFFDSNPAGRILNRFAKDLSTIDNTLPGAIDEFFSILCKTVLSICLTAVINPYILLALLPLCGIFYRLRKKFMMSARELKRLESVSRSPIYAHIGETMTGLVTIRSLGMQERFAQEFREKVDSNQEAFYAFISTSRWLSTRLETLNTVFLLVCTGAALVIKHLNTVSSVPLAGLAGLALANLMNLGERFQWMVRLSAEIETHLVSVERIREYCTLPSEAPREIPQDFLMDHTWPQNGQLRFENYSVRYRPDLPLVLRELTCNLPGGVRIAVVGRTGAGKSSLVRALFRLVEASHPTEADLAELDGRGGLGTCFLDGVDIATLGLKKLRRSMSIIPQTPWLFAGSFRYNLDPFNEFSDANIEAVLRDVQLSDTGSDRAITLDSPVAEGGANFSTGQRQLACLARALLSQNKVIVCDEATANVDPATDAIIQRVLREKFVGRTVITIAHRLATIIDNDMVLVLQQGKLAEMGHPYELLCQPQSIFKDMVDETGKENAANLLSLSHATWQARSN